MRTIRHLFSLPLLLLLFTACDQFDFDEQDEAKEYNVVLRVTSFKQMPFDNMGSTIGAQQQPAATRAPEDIAKLCSRLHFVIFKNGERVKMITQQSGDKDFGTVSLTLPEGDYDMAVVAHNCNGNATITDLQKITFPNNIVSDTFYTYGQLTIDGSDGQTFDLTLERAVAMFRLRITDAIPSDVAKMKFYYTGGSSTFSAQSGFGSVNSKQTVNLLTSDAMIVDGATQFEVYTFPHAETDELKITITAQDASGNTVQEQIFEKVPVKLNTITVYEGSFFGEAKGSSETNVFQIKADGEWDGTNTYQF